MHVLLTCSFDVVNLLSRIFDVSVKEYSSPRLKVETEFPLCPFRVKELNFLPRKKTQVDLLKINWLI